MDNLVNQALIEKRVKMARIASYIGFGALFAGLLSASSMLWLSYVLLLVGLVAASAGSFLASNYVKEPRADVVLADSLEVLDKRYKLYHYFFPANHLLLSHFGLTVLSPYAQSGEISFDGNRWRHKAGIRKLKQLIGDPSLGQPHKELAHEVESVQKWLAEGLPDEEIPVNGVIVFLNPNVELTLQGNAVDAVKVEELANLVKNGFKGRPVLSTSMQRRLRQMLDDAANAA